MQAGDANNDDGFAMVDALTALVVLAVTVTLCISTVTIGRRLALSAADTRQAGAALEYLMDVQLETAGTLAGAQGSLRWRLSLERLNLPSMIYPACRRSAEVRVRPEGKAFAAASFEPCPRPRGDAGTARP